ncbi:cytochrome b561 [Aureimonas endophytica]|uniref:Cytochrome b561 n=1 Tax=Aureimonas endophytica TaxID=2027858 RepID=A0A916ZHD4_9HYPH|nr:cytochrome b/b6 domain-containing protein [Aureimonas endophytica]GGD97658.1 cytochrome b561 [Aureimonas endophytica]
MIRTRDIRGYNAGAMLLHWTIALAILFQLVLGFAMMRLDILPDGLRFPLFQWHKTVGLLVLALTLARIAWRVFNPPPAHAPMSTVETGLAHLVHFLFYVLMLAVPLSGWLLVSVSPTAIPTLLAMSATLPWPHLPLPVGWVGEAPERYASLAHAWLAYSTAGLLVLHVAGAAKHSMIDRVPSFSRMLPAGHLHRQSTALVAIPLAVALVAVFLGGGVAIGQSEAHGPAGSGAGLAASAGPSGWAIDKAASTLRYEVEFSGKTVGGTIGAWNAAILFDPKNPAAGSAKVTVDAASIAIDDPFVASNVPGPDGFDVAAHPTVSLALDRFEAAGAGFVGHGTLTVKDKTVPVDVPFTFAEENGKAHVAGKAVLDRLALGLGTGNDGTAQWLGKDVTVILDLLASPAPAETASPAS